MRTNWYQQLTGLMCAGLNTFNVQESSSLSKRRNSVIAYWRWEPMIFCKKKLIHETQW